MEGIVKLTKGSSIDPQDTGLQPVRLEFPILSLNPGLRQRCMASDVWPTRNGMATRSGTLARIRLRAAVRRQLWRKRVGTPAA